METLALVSVLKSFRNQFSPVVPYFPGKDKLMAFDLTEANNEITEQVVLDTRSFTEYVERKLANAGARYGIGGYAEHRSVYSRSRLFGSVENNIPPNENAEANEPRRLHLGIDIWGKPHTAVTAPVDGIVHSFAYNDAFGDYGATIILTHRLGDISFHTLYGHLSLNSIKNLREGEWIGQGDIFAEFGIPSENGHWPPHLHFQVIADLQGWKGDFPGVCRFSEKEKWLSNCPDPDLILQMNQYIS